MFLDAELGYMIYYKGEHVLTIGFAPSKDGILIAQFQCAKKKGNRWLYKLPKSLDAYVVERMQAAFPGEDVYLVDGKSMASKIRSSYPPDVPKEKLPTEETLNRISCSYARVSYSSRNSWAKLII